MTDITPLLETVGGLTEETRSKFDTLARRLGDRPSDATERDDPAETDPHAVLATLIRINHDLFERMDRLAAEVVGPEAVLRKIVRDPFENLRFYTGIQFWLSSGDHLAARERNETLMIRRHDKYDCKILFSLTHMAGPDTFNFIEEDALRETADFVRPHRPRDFRRDHRHKTYGWKDAAGLERALPHIIKGSAGWKLACIYRHLHSPDYDDFARDDGMVLYRRSVYGGDERSDRT